MLSTTVNKQRASKSKTKFYLFDCHPRASIKFLMNPEGKGYVCKAPHQLQSALFSTLPHHSQREIIQFQGTMISDE